VRRLIDDDDGGCLVHVRGITVRRPPWLYIPANAALGADPGAREVSFPSNYEGTVTASIAWSALTMTPAYNPTQAK